MNKENITEQVADALKEMFTMENPPRKIKINTKTGEKTIIPDDGPKEKDYFSENEFKDKLNELGIKNSDEIINSLIDGKENIKVFELKVNREKFDVITQISNTISEYIRDEIKNTDEIFCDKADFYNAFCIVISNIIVDLVAKDKSKEEKVEALNSTLDLIKSYNIYNGGLVFVDNKIVFMPDEFR